MNLKIFQSKTLFVFLFGWLVAAMISGCTSPTISTTSPLLPINTVKSIALYPFYNYTDTPRAGLRAVNLVEGVLLSKGYTVSLRSNNASSDMGLGDQISNARNHDFDFILVGGVSEWRYKTGIDGEPAISLQMKLIDVKTKKVIWSATGSYNSWGNASIGTVAQELIESMVTGQKDFF